ncbi:hypothetical protein GQ457_13G014480 [Hibiscus cannabinus]
MTQPELVPLSSDGAQSGGSSCGASKVFGAFTNKKVNVVLDEFNFLVWKQQVLLAVRSLHLEKLLTGSLKAPPATIRAPDGTMIENEAYEVFVAQDTALASWLLSTISASLLPQFIGTDTAVEIWAIVLRLFANRSTTTVMSLHYKLRSLKKGDMSMTAYVSQVKEICNALASSGSPISDLETIATILNGLSIEYQPFVAVITASREPFTLDAAISVLLDAGVQLSSFNLLSDISSTLNVVQMSVSTLDTRRDIASATTRPYRQSSNGHGNSGRMRLQCQLFTARAKDLPKNEVNYVFVSNPDLSSHGCSCHCACATLQSGSDTMQAAASPQVNLVAATSDHWFVDSGASHHVSPNPNHSRADSTYYGPGKLTIGNGVSLPISSVGNTVLNSPSRPLHLRNILHVPGITKNLISMSKISRDNDIFLEFHASSCLVREEGSGVVILTGSVVDGLYRFDSCLPLVSSSNKLSSVQANVVVKSDMLYDLWHRRLGHPTHDSLVQVNNGVSNSIESSGSQVAVSGAIPLVPGVETLWTVERELVSTLETPNVVVQEQPSYGGQPVRVGTVKVPIPDVSNVALGCSNEMVPTNFSVSSTATPIPCQSTAGGSRVNACTRTVMENGSGFNSTSFEPAVELELVVELEPAS